MEKIPKKETEKILVIQSHDEPMNISKMVDTEFVMSKNSGEADSPIHNTKYGSLKLPREHELS